MDVSPVHSSRTFPANSSPDGIGTAIPEEMKFIYPESDPDPLHHAVNVQQQITDRIEHLRGDLQQFQEPKTRALFEAAVEVLVGLRTAFERFEKSVS